MKTIFKSHKQNVLLIFIATVMFLLVCAASFYLLNRIKSNQEIYITVLLNRPKDFSAGPIDWIPYWLGNSIEIGDKEMNPLGGENAIVIEKESVDSLTSGQTVTLLLKINSIKDRSGIYLYKNKPLSVGSILDLNLTKSKISAYVTSVNKSKPQNSTVILRIYLKGSFIEPEVLNSIQEGAIQKDNNGRVIAKIIKKTILPSEEAISSGSRILSITNYTSKQDVIVVMDVLTKKNDSAYFFIDNQRIRVSDSFYISFPEIKLQYQIIKIEKLNESEIR